MTWRSTTIAVIGFIAVLILEIGVGYWFVTSSTGQGIMRDFLVSQIGKRIAAEPAITAPPAPLYQKTTLPIPERYATYDYFIAINNVIADIALINNANLELGPALDDLNTKTLACSFNGLYDLMGRARVLANRNQALAAQFLMHINSLAAANAKTSDAVTKSQTQTLVSAGQILGESLQAYGTGVQTLLYGDTPRSDDIAKFQAQVAATIDASQVFADALKPLLAHIGKEIDRLSAASSTPAR